MPKNKPDSVFNRKDYVRDNNRRNEVTPKNWYTSKGHKKYEKGINNIISYVESILPEGMRFELTSAYDSKSRSKIVKGKKTTDKGSHAKAPAHDFVITGEAISALDKGGPEIEAIYGALQAIGQHFGISSDGRLVDEKGKKHGTGPHIHYQYRENYKPNKARMTKEYLHESTNRLIKALQAPPRKSHKYGTPGKGGAVWEQSPTFPEDYNDRFKNHASSAEAIPKPESTTDDVFRSNTLLARRSLEKANQTRAASSISRLRQQNFAELSGRLPGGSGAEEPPETAEVKA